MLRLNLCVERLEGRFLLAGITVVTHGFQGIPYPDWSNPLACELPIATTGFPNWAGNMANAISSYFTSPQTIISRPEGIVGGGRPEADHTIILFDWVEESVNCGTAIDNDVAGRLENVINDLLAAAGEKADMHFIGHSRGAYVNAAAIERLAKSPYAPKINFLQMTTLDPQEFFDGELTANPGGIVDWADNYYQRPLLQFPGGNLLPGGMNLDLTSLVTDWAGREIPFAEHAEIHDWYHWTIDRSDSYWPDSAVDADEPYRQILYTNPYGMDFDPLDGEKDDWDEGRKIGYYYSLAGGGFGVVDTSDFEITQIVANGTPIPHSELMFGKGVGEAKILGDQVVFLGESEDHVERGIYAYRDGGIETLVDRQTSIVGKPGSFFWFHDFFLNSTGDLVFFASVDDPSVERGLFRLSDGHAVPLVTINDQIPNTDLQVVLGPQSVIAIDGERILFTAEERANGQFTGVGIYSFENETFSKVFDFSVQGISEPLWAGTGRLLIDDNSAIFGSAPTGTVYSGGIYRVALGETGEPEVILDPETDAFGDLKLMMIPQVLALDGNGLTFFANWGYPDEETIVRSGIYRISAGNVEVIADNVTPPIPEGPGDPFAEVIMGAFDSQGDRWALLAEVNDPPLSHDRPRQGLFANVDGVLRNVWDNEPYIANYFSMTSRAVEGTSVVFTGEHGGEKFTYDRGIFLATLVPGLEVVTPPVRGVFVGSSQWNRLVSENLDRVSGLGLGYYLFGGTNVTPNHLPYVNPNQVTVWYSKPLSLERLSELGQVSPLVGYDTSEEVLLTYDPDHYSVTWTFRERLESGYHRINTDELFGRNVSLSFWVEPGDINHDGLVDLLDFAPLKAAFGTLGSGVPGDLDGDGDVDLNDFSWFKQFFGSPGAVDQALATEGAFWQ